MTPDHDSRPDNLKDIEARIALLRKALRPGEHIADDRKPSGYIASALAVLERLKDMAMLDWQRTWSRKPLRHKPEP